MRVAERGTNLDLGRVVRNDTLGDLRSLAEDNSNAATRSSEGLHPALRTARLDGLLDRLGRLGQSLDEREGVGSGADEGSEEGEERFEGGSLEERRLDEFEDAGEDGGLNLLDDGGVVNEEGRDGVEGEGEEVDIRVVDERLEVCNEHLGGLRRETGSRANEQGGDAPERGNLEGTIDLAKEGGDLDEAFLDPRVELGTLADGRFGDLADDLDGDETRRLVLEPIVKESERSVEIPSEEVSGVEEESAEADDSLALDLLVGVRARQPPHRRVVDGRELRPDGRRDGGDGIDGAEDSSEVGGGHEAFCGNLVELVADGCEEEGDDPGELVNIGLRVVGAEEEAEEGEDLDLERRRRSREPAVGHLEGGFDPSNEAGDLGLESAVEDRDQLVEEDEAGLASSERLGGKLLDDRLGDGGSLRA